MLPFCGYNMAEYFQNWLDMGNREGAQLPKLFYVNWFRKDPDSGKFLWPGFGENSRVLKWIFERCTQAAEGTETAVGIVPAPGELDVAGLDISDDDLAQVVEVDPAAFKAQLPQMREFLAKFGDDLPPEIGAQLDAFEQRLEAAS
jgi:phosphoenolpyruvate carboxykinase (GTP)